MIVQSVFMSTLVLNGLHPVVIGGEGDVAESIRRIEKLLDTSIEFHELDLLDRPGLEKLFKKVRALTQLITSKLNQSLNYHPIDRKCICICSHFIWQKCCFQIID